MARKIIDVPARSLSEYRLLTGLTDLDRTMSNVDLTARLCRRSNEHLMLKIPILSAAMQAVTGSRLAIALAQYGGLGVFPCSIPIDEEVRQIQEVKRFKGGFQTEVIALGPTDRLERAVALERERGFSTFPVTEDGSPHGRMIGLLTDKNFDPRKDRDLPVSARMISDPDVGVEITDLKEANRLLVQYGHGVLPIVDREGRLSAVVFKKDLEKHLDFPDERVDERKRLMVAAAASTQPRDRERIAAVAEAGADVIVVDSSDGYSTFQGETIEHIKGEHNLPVISGNIITEEGFLHLAESGADAIKIGMGIGAGCITQEVKGTGRGQATAMIEVARARDAYAERTGTYLPLIADGGIENSGGMVVALALGADSLMMGRFFAGFTESAGPARRHPVHGSVKEYWMEASDKARNYGRYETTRDFFFEEGVEGFVEHIGSLYDHFSKTIHQIKAGLSSAGCCTIEELHRNAVVELQSVVALRDSGIHGIQK